MKTLTFAQAAHEVAKKHGLGSTLVTGHKAAYFQEAAQLYAKSKWDEACEAMVEDGAFGIKHPEFKP